MTMPGMVVPGIVSFNPAVQAKSQGGCEEDDEDTRLRGSFDP